MAKYLFNIFTKAPGMIVGAQTDAKFSAFILLAWDIVCKKYRCANNLRAVLRATSGSDVITARYAVWRAALSLISGYKMRLMSINVNKY